MQRGKNEPTPRSAAPRSKNAGYAPVPTVDNRIRWTISDGDKAERLDDVEPRYPPTGCSSSGNRATQCRHLQTTTASCKIDSFGRIQRMLQNTNASTEGSEAYFYAPS